MIAGSDPHAPRRRLRHLARLHLPGARDLGQAPRALQGERREEGGPARARHGAKRKPRRSADNRERYAAIRDAHAKIRAHLKRARADAVLLIGDDQAENFTADNMPQLLVYTGGDYVADDWDRKHTATVRNHPEIARKLVAGAVEKGFDVCLVGRAFATASCSRTRTPSRSCISSAKSGVPVVPVFVNAVHPPAPSAARCYAFGQALGARDRRATSPTSASCCAPRAACRISRLRIPGRTTSAPLRRRHRGRVRPPDRRVDARGPGREARAASPRAS